MSILAKYHIHLDLNLSDEVKISGRDYLEELVRKSSIAIFDQEVEINIEYKDGSIHYFIEVVAILFGGITAYGAIRSFIDYSIKDSKTLGSIIKSRLLKNGFPEDQIVEFTRLKGSSDRVRLLYLHLDRFEKSLTVYSYDEMSSEIRLIGKKLDQLAYELTGDDLSIIVNDIRSRGIPQLTELYRDISRDVSFGKKDAGYFPFNY